MKRFCFFLAVAFLAACQNTPNPVATEEQENFLKPMIQEEMVYVTKNIEGLQNDKGKDWYQGDMKYFGFWKDGITEELDGNFKKAIDYYTKALNTKRYEISSYEVKLSLGRVYLQLNQKKKAKQMLDEFKAEAQKDLNGEDVEWGLTDEAKEALSRDIEDCDYLLGMMQQ
jgi:tetratricopeptide (TPR) repeat protein